MKGHCLMNSKIIPHKFQRRCTPNSNRGSPLGETQSKVIWMEKISTMFSNKGEINVKFVWCSHQLILFNISLLSLQLISKKTRGNVICTHTKVSKYVFIYMYIYIRVVLILGIFEFLRGQGLIWFEINKKKYPPKFQVSISILTCAPHWCKFPI